MTRNWMTVCSPNMVCRPGSSYATLRKTRSKRSITAPRVRICSLSDLLTSFTLVSMTWLWKMNHRVVMLTLVNIKLKRQKKSSDWINFMVKRRLKNLKKDLKYWPTMRIRRSLNYQSGIRGGYLPTRCQWVKDHQSMSTLQFKLESRFWRFSTIKSGSSCWTLQELW